MSTKEWLERTNGGWTATRSSALKSVDNALADYHINPSPKNKEVLKARLGAWIKNLGDSWKTDDRNKNHAVENLLDQLDGNTNVLRPAEQRAVAFVRDAGDGHSALLTQLFGGQKLILRGEYLKALRTTKFDLGRNVALTGYDIAQLTPGAMARAKDIAQSTSAAMARAREFVKSIVPPEHHSTVFDLLSAHMPTFMTDLAKSMTPFLGVATSALSTAVSMAKVGRDEYRVYRASECQSRALCVKDPALAIRGLLTILERECEREWDQLKINGAAFATKLTLTLTGVGGAIASPITGLTETFAKLVLYLQELVVDLDEANKGNEMMALRTSVDPKVPPRPNIGSNVLEECPLLAAYLICCAPTSAMLSVVFKDFSQRGWLDKLEYEVQKCLVPLREQAGRVVREHRFIIEKLYRHPGCLEVNKAMLKDMEKRVGLADRRGDFSGRGPSAAT
jgi:hypothetical protein